MALAGPARLVQQSCRFLSGRYTAVRHAHRGVITAAEWQREERSGNSRGEGGRRGGGKRPGRDASESASIWGDDWDVDGKQKGGWLDADSSGSGSPDEQRSRSSGASGQRERDGRGGGGSWGERRSERGSAGRSSFDRADGGRGWGNREGGSERGSTGRSSSGREDGGRGWGSRERDGRREWSGGEGQRRREWNDGGRGGNRDLEAGERGSSDRWDGGERGGGRRAWGNTERGSGRREWDKTERGSGRREWDKTERGSGRREWDGGERGSGRREWDRGERGSGRREWDRSERGRRDGDAGAPGEGDGEGGFDSAPGGGGLRQFWVGDVLYGVSPVQAALSAGRRTIHTLYLQEGLDLSKRKDRGAIQAAKQRAEELGARVEYASKHDLNMVADNRPHQGIVLDCSPLDFEALEVLPAPELAPGGGGRLPVWLALDEVMDPQNFGAALRCAHFLGVAGVLACRRNSAPLSAAVSKASAGAMELMPVHSCKNLPQTLAAAQAAGWLVLGAAAEPGAARASQFILDRPAVLVMGNEGYGLRTTVRRLCDAMLQIEESGAERSGLVDSLNVSVATGILLHRLLTAQAAPAAAAPAAAAPAAAAGGVE